MLDLINMLNSRVILKRILLMGGFWKIISLIRKMKTVLELAKRLEFK